jgi:hypothetical protein
MQSSFPSTSLGVFKGEEKKEFKKGMIMATYA